MAILLTELSMVALTVGLNQFRRMFMDSFQQHNFQHFLEAIAFFSAMAAAWVLSKGYNSYFKRGLSFIWREALYLKLTSGVLNETGTNEQRLTMDLEELTTMTLTLATACINAFITLPIFIYLLVSTASPWFLLPIAIWVIVGSRIAKWIAQPLVQLSYEQESRESTLRQKILTWDKSFTKAPVLDDVKQNWSALMIRAKKLGFFQSGYLQAAVVFPHLLLARQYFFGTLSLGVLFATADAMKVIIECSELIIEKQDDISKLESVINRIVEMETK